MEDGGGVESVNGSIFEEEEVEHLSRDPLYIVIPITVVYAVIFMTGIVGNVSTCVVISRNRSMHTATNYYLFSLAISDLLLLVSGLPPEIYLIWSRYPYVFGEVFCVFRGLAAETSANATVLTITAFTVERYVAICHPFLSHTMSKLSRAVRLILVIWIVALGFAVLQAMQFGILYDDFGVPFICSQKRVLIERSFEISTFLFFVLPMTLITVLYALIGLKLRRSNMMSRERSQNRAFGSAVNQRPPRKEGATQSSRRVLKMLVAVVVAFFICWAPFHAQRLVAIYAAESQLVTLYAILTYVSGVLYYLSTTINPLLYHIMSNKFREAFKETISRWCGSAERGEGGGERCGGPGHGDDISGGPGRRYTALARPPPGRAFNTQDSSDYSGNSIREEGYSYGGGACEGTLRGQGRSGRSTSTYTTELSLETCPKCNSSRSGGSVAYQHQVPSSVRIHFGGGQEGRRKRRGLLCVLGCSGAQDEDLDGDLSPGLARTKLTVDSETQTDTDNLRPTRAFGEVDTEALSDELTSYMEELHRREKSVIKLNHT